MRIAYIASGIINEQARVNYFARKGHEVHLICREAMDGYDESVYIHLLTRFPVHGWTTSRHLSFPFWILQTRKLVREIKPDIIDSYYTTVYGFIAACSGFCSLVVTALGSDILIDAKQNLLLRMFTRYALKKADIVICNSETVRKGIIQLKIAAEKIRLIYNGIDTEQFCSKAKDEKTSDRLDNIRTPLIISIRYLRPLYNVEMLIRAIPLILRQFPQVKFLIGGDGDLRENLECLANTLGISNTVTFIGYIPHERIVEYLVLSDIYISTSCSDGTSFSLQEAMSCALAPIVTDLPANREWVTDGKNGFLIAINDIQALADRIVYLLRNDEVRREFGRLSRNIVKARAEFKKEMKRLEVIYEELVRRNR